MKYKKGDIAKCVMSYTNDFHSVLAGNEYVIVRDDDKYISIECDHPRCNRDLCRWINGSLEKPIFEILPAITTEEIQSAVSLPPLDDVAAFVNTLTTPRLEV